MNIEDEQISPLDMLSPMTPGVVREQLRRMLVLEVQLHSENADREFIYKSVNVLNRIFSKIPFDTVLLSKLTEEMTAILRMDDEGKLDLEDADTLQAANQAVLLSACFSAYRNEERDVVERRYRELRARQYEPKTLLQ